ncbi:hypothetical protein [Streptomyces sp. NPDC002221]|uniref:hypothetical protein n=1 Tax=Streptomyces sp. NPDC002221 TaxID=3364639 RepID=UPI0036AE8DE0
MRAFKRLDTVFATTKSLLSHMPAVWSRLSCALNPWGALRAEREATILYLTYAADTVDIIETRLDQYRNAVCEFASLFNDGMLASHVAERFTCSEAEGIAEFFRAVEHPDVADLWLECHAEGDDDEDDLHYQGERSEPVELVLAS